MTSRARQLLLSVLPAPLLGWMKRKRARGRSDFLGNAPVETVFTEIKRRNLWCDGESLSGGGSTLEFTERVRQWLPMLFSELGVKTFVDIPCGDFWWMQHVPMNGIHYIGGDIVKDLVEANREKFGGPDRKFIHLDLAKDSLPAGDLLLCKDCFVHLEHKLAVAALANIRRTPIRYVLLTTYPQQTRNVNILTGDTWRVNMELPPFNLPKPRQRVVEGVEADYEKHLGLWAVSDLQSVSA